MILLLSGFFFVSLSKPLGKVCNLYWKHPHIMHTHVFCFWSVFVFVSYAISRNIHKCRSNRSLRTCKHMLDAQDTTKSVCVSVLPPYDVIIVIIVSNFCCCYILAYSTPCSMTFFASIGTRCMSPRQMIIECICVRVWNKGWYFHLYIVAQES